MLDLSRHTPLLANFIYIFIYTCWCYSLVLSLSLYLVSSLYYIASFCIAVRFTYSKLYSVIWPWCGRLYASHSPDQFKSRGTEIWIIKIVQFGCQFIMLPSHALNSFINYSVHGSRRPYEIRKISQVSRNFSIIKFVWQTFNVRQHHVKWHNFI